jgi:tetratricopeptide (TPR) repeat protein
VVGLSLALVACLAVLGIVGIQRRVWAGKGVVWFFLALGVPFVLPLNILVSEQRLYLPAVGLVGAVVSLAAASGRGRAVWAPGLVALVLLGILTWQRNQLWASDLRLWRDAATKAPRAFRTHGNLGLARYEAGDLSGAKSALLTALELNPGYAKTWNNLGLVLEESGDREGAGRAFGRALHLRPDLSGAHLNLARLYLHDGQLDSARQHLDRAARLQPDHPRVLVARGLLRQRAGDLTGAMAAYDRALALDPYLAEGHNNRGLLLDETGEPDRALASLRRAVAADTGYVEAQVNLALLEARRAGVGPRQVYEQVLARHPGAVRVWLALADQLQRDRQWAEAARALEEALSLAPDLDVDASLASAYHGSGRLEEAIAAYRRALARDPGPGLLVNLAAAYAEAGRLAEAAAALAEALAIDPSHQRALQGLERLSERGAKGEVR